MRSFEFLNQERVIFEAAAGEAVALEVERRGSRSVLLVTSRSLASHATVGDIKQRLGRRLIDHIDSIEQHVPLESVLAVAGRLREIQPDLVVVVGGGSPIDTIKIATLALAHDIRSIDGLLAATDAKAGGSRAAPPYRTIAVPTTLSGAEFGVIGAGVDVKTGIKHVFRAPYFCASAVIYDPQLACATPEWLWLSTGIRAVDHAVEGLLSPDANPFTDATEIHALGYLRRGLQASKADPASVAARSDCQIGVWLASTGIGRVRYGASHGIGHQLGAVASVPHGITSCILLPIVLGYNKAVSHGRYGLIARALGREDDNAPAAVRELVKSLSLPTSLQGISFDRALLPVVAETCLGNGFVRANPRPVASKEDALQILTKAWDGTL
jgi:alcohol dehydrogenase class IV